MREVVSQNVGRYVNMVDPCNCGKDQLQQQALHSDFFRDLQNCTFALL